MKLNEVRIEFFRWSLLGRVGRSRVLRSSYVWLFVVPLAAKALSGLSGLTFIIPVWGKEIHFQAGLPFSWKVFFFSALAFSIGGFVYSFRCPAIIKNFPYFMAFLQQGRDIGYFDRYRKVYPEVKQLLEEYENRIKPLVPSPIKLRPTTAVLQETEQFSRSTAQVLFWKARELEDRSKLVAFSICALAYAVGFILFLWVAVENILFVWRFG